jgi:2-polyprenyl-3-methyl-5-hydroxy-6-metoxy-1,4-benzoquinol methylase
MIREKIIADFCRNKNVLDIGSIGQSDKYCLWTSAYIDAKKLTGIDLPNAEEHNLCTIKFDPKGVKHAGDQRIVKGNMENYLFKEKFDVIVAGDVIEHVSNQGLFLDNIHSHLAPSGILILTTPNAKWPTVVLRPNPTHVLWHDKHTLKQLLERHNFSIKKLLFYEGNKESYPFFIRLLLLQQQIFVAAALK